MRSSPVTPHPKDMHGSFDEPVRRHWFSSTGECHLPEREVMTGVGPVAVKVPRVRDRGDQAEKVRFTSSILPSYLRKAKAVEELLPWLYLKGISTGDFQEALAALLGPMRRAQCGGLVAQYDFPAQGRLVGGL